MATQEEREYRLVRLALTELRTAAALVAPIILRQDEQNPTQFNLIAPTWRLSLYPGQQRIYRGGYNDAPVLTLPSPWTLTDVAIELRRVMGMQHG